MAELKPCDCGQAHPFIEMQDFFKIGWRYYVWCPSCNTESDLYETEEKAIDAWNKRSK